MTLVLIGAPPPLARDRDPEVLGGPKKSARRDAYIELVSRHLHEGFRICDSAESRKCYGAPDRSDPLEVRPRGHEVLHHDLAGSEHAAGAFE